MKSNRSYPFIKYDFHRLDEAEMQRRSSDFYELLSHRRTIREFSSESIPEGILETIIKTAGTAPSGANKQPWVFCLVTDPDIKHRIRVAVEEEEATNYESRFPDDWLEDLAPLETNPIKQHIDDAPALIIVFKENYRLGEEHIKKNYYVTESVGIAIGFLVAAIHNAGLVSLVHTPNPMPFMNQILNRPQNEKPVALIPVGYPKAGTLVPDINRKSLNEILIRFDKRRKE